MNTKPLVRFALGFITLLVALSASAQLQYYWDATSPIMSSPGSGGTGSWSTSAADWWVSGSSDSVWANGNIANFAGTAGTVTLGGAVTANGLTFTTPGYTIATGNTLTLAGPPTISLPGGTTAINCIIAGSSGLTTSGSGTLTLSGVNTYTGGTTNGFGCTLTIGGSGKLGSGSYSGAIANAGTFDWTSSASQTLSGVISGAGNLIQGGGTLTLTAANSYTGGTTINSGKTLTLGSGGKLNSSGNITNNGTFNYNNANSWTLNGVISGSGSLSVNPSGSQGLILTLNGSNTYTGTTTIDPFGQIVINSDSSLGTPPATFTAGQLLLNFGFLNANGTFTLNSNRGITMQIGEPFGAYTVGASIQVQPGNTLTIGAPIAGAYSVISGSGEPQYGGGTNLFAASSTYTGATGISTGRLMLGKNGALPSGTTMAIAADNFSGAFFDMNGFNQTIGPLSSTNTLYPAAGTGSGTPTIILSGALTVLQTNISTVFSGLITGSGSLTINGNASGTLSLSNYANTYTGVTTVNGGTLDISTGNSSISGNVTVNGGTLELDNDAALSTISTLTMSPGVVVDLNYSGTQTVAALNFGATPQATGLWGAVGNAGATFTDSRFTGSGLLLVCPTPSQTITPATASDCAGSTTTASVPVTAGATYSWSVLNGTVTSGANSSTVTYSVQQAYSPIYLNCVVTSSCGVASAGNQNLMVPVNVCGLVVQASNNVVYSASNGATITANGIPGATWYLNASTNVTAPLPWPTIQSGTISSSPFTVTDPTATNYGQQFYYLTNATSP